jgi:hypothetical protein
VERHGFFAEHVLAGAQGGDSLWGVQEDGRRDVDGIGRGMRQSGIQIGKSGDRVALSLGGASSDDSGELAARFSKDGGEHAPGGNVANAYEQPAKHPTLPESPA